MELEFYRQTVEEILISNSMKIRQLGAEWRERERQTDQWKDMTKLIIALSTSANAPDVQSVNTA